MRNKLYTFFIEKGVILRPVGNIIYVLPPYIISDIHLEKIYQIFEVDEESEIKKLNSSSDIARLEELTKKLKILSPRFF